MTDWGRVEKLRQKGRSWEEVAADPRAGFVPPDGADPGRSLKALYARRRSERGGRSRDSPTVERPVQRAARMVTRTRVAATVALVVVVALILWFVLLSPARPSPTSDVVSYCGGEGSTAHYHPLLVINVNGVQQPLPEEPAQSADIGYVHNPAFTNPSLYCAAGGVHALHTHDGSGIIHVELPATVVDGGVTPTLGNFFQIWGQNLSSTHVWTYSGSLKATVLDMHSGSRTDYSGNPGSIPLYAPYVGPVSNPFPIPASLTFGGAYGTGSTGGGFSGEIIWLNVTGGASSMLTPTVPPTDASTTASVAIVADSHRLCSTIGATADGTRGSGPQLCPAREPQ